MKTLINRITAHEKIVIISVFIMSFIISSGVVAITEREGIQREKGRANQNAIVQSGKIQYVVNNLLFTTRTMDALIHDGHGSMDNFDETMESLLENYAIASASLAPDGIVTQTYPLAGNEASIGHHLLEDPERSLEAILAKETGQLTLAGPYILKQGGFGAIGRLPVYFSNEAGEPSFWGFVCVVLELPDALAGAEMEKLEEQGYAYELWHIEPNTKEKQTLMKSEIDISEEPQEATLALPNSTWTLSLVPIDGWINYPRLFLKEFTALLISILVALLFHNVIKLTKSRNELEISMQQQTLNYKKMDELNGEIRNFRHDMKNHLLTLSTLLEKNDIAQSKAYIQSIGEESITHDAILNTENYVFDALLVKKIALAKEKGIQVDKEIMISKQLKIENKDWSILFGNILDNAIEACEKVIDKKPQIMISVRYKGNMLYGKVSNTAQVEPKQENGNFITTKPDSTTHGMGMQRIANTVKKYNGIMETTYINGIFTISFTLMDV